MTDRDERWRPGGPLSDERCIWCEQETCELVKTYGDVAKYQCRNCGKSHWA